MLHWILIVVQLVSAVFIVILVLLQRGKGAEAGAGFGAGASGTVFGARGASTALSRATAILAAIFMLNSLALTYMSTRAHTQHHATILDLAGQSKTPTAGATGRGNSSSSPTPQTAPATPAPLQPPH
jgi:preprotein translocase subunit SecG